MSINLFKTIYVNYVYFGLAGVKCLPVIVYQGVCLKELGGAIIIEHPLKHKMLLIGAGGIGTLDFKYERTEWNVRGQVVVNGQVSIGKGCRISVGENAHLIFNGDFHMSGRSSIICEKEICFGHDVLLSWDILIMDSDFHFIYDKDSNLINRPKAIFIGDHVWIGCRCTVLKGVKVAKDVIVAAGALVTTSIDKENSIYGGVGENFRELRDNVSWSATNNNIL